MWLSVLWVLLLSVGRQEGLWRTVGGRGRTGRTGRTVSTGASFPISRRAAKPVPSRALACPPCPPVPTRAHPWPITCPGLRIECSASSNRHLCIAMCLTPRRRARSIAGNRPGKLRRLRARRANSKHSACLRATTRLAQIALTCGHDRLLLVGCWWLLTVRRGAGNKSPRHHHRPVLPSFRAHRALSMHSGLPPAVHHLALTVPTHLPRACRCGDSSLSGMVLGTLSLQHLHAPPQCAVLTIRYGAFSLASRSTAAGHRGR